MYHFFLSENNGHLSDCLQLLKMIVVTFKDKQRFSSSVKLVPLKSNLKMGNIVWPSLRQHLHTWLNFALVKALALILFTTNISPITEVIFYIEQKQHLHLL